MITKLWIVSIHEKIWCKQNDGRHYYSLFGWFQNEGIRWCIYFWWIHLFLRDASLYYLSLSLSFLLKSINIRVCIQIYRFLYCIIGISIRNAVITRRPFCKSTFCHRSDVTRLGKSTVGFNSITGIVRKIKFHTIR